MVRHYFKTPEQVDVYCRNQQWFERLRGIQQDPIWHAEGDVWTHSCMVVEELWKSEEFDSFNLDITPEQQVDLTLAAFLHDTGKYFCTQEVDGRIRSFGHSLKSFRIAKTILPYIDLSLTRRNKILNLIRYHGKPHYLYEQNVSPEISIAVQSTFCPLNELFIIAKADMLGRINKEDPENEFALLVLEQNQQVAQTLGCWDLPYVFTSGLQLLWGSRMKLPTLSFVPYKDYDANVVMVAGLPGSGKDTLIDKMYSDRFCISLDDIRRTMKVKPTDNQGKVIQEAKQQYKNALAKGEKIVLNGTHLTRRLRSKWLEIAEAYNAYTKIIYIEPKLDLTLERNLNRQYAVPENVWIKMLHQLDIPQPYEANHVKLTEGV